MQPRAAHALLLFLSALISCTHRPEQQVGSKEKRISMTAIPRFDAAPATAFSAPLASSARNSRVSVNRRHFLRLERIELPAAIRGPMERPPRPTASITIKPDGSEVLLWCRDLSRVRRDPLGNLHVGGPPADWEVDNSPLTFAEKRDRDSDLSVMDFTDLNGARSVTVTRRARSGSTLWASGRKGAGLAAAIDGTWHAVLVMHEAPSPNESAEGQYVVAVYGPEGNQEGQGALLFNRRLAFVPTDLSLVPPYIALVERTGNGTQLHALRGDGQEAWTVDVPLSPTVPPVDGANGRAYLVGNGLATIDEGKVVSVIKTDTPFLVTAFSDGSLALVSGKTVQLVARNGVIEQQFESAEPIVTQPAIAPNGDVWLASDTALYVLQ